MTTIASSRISPQDVASRIMVALDVGSADEARSIARELAGFDVIYKIGLQLFTAAGRNIVEEFVANGNRVFLDLKFHDIPNTVSGAAAEAARLGVWMYNVHALGGSTMMRSAKDASDEAAARLNLTPPLAVAVTVLTSSADQTLAETGIAASAGEQVARLAKLAASAGMDGVVASALEVPSIKAGTRPEFLTITPGIRPSSATKDDQERVMTVAAALQNGSDYLVIGRPIVGASDRRAALEFLLRSGVTE